MSDSDPELNRLEVLMQFKTRMPSKELGLNISPFDDQVTTAAGDVTAYDLRGIHPEVRQYIETTLADVRHGRKKSQVILLSGDAGSGKTHLLRTFQSPLRAEEVGYIYVGGSNQWKIGEFEARLLDWMIEALTAPSPNAEHPLLERIRVIGFRALEQLLANPVSWKQCLARPERNLFGWIWGQMKPPTYDQLKALADARNPDAFALLDFASFSAYVCDRFLVERSNLTHRYALRVLLTYLFPDHHERGVGIRERVLHWFRGMPDGDYFHRRLGAAEKLDRQFTIFEAVKLLIHLFSQAVARELSTADRPCPPKVFLLVFDQAEGRNELFDNKNDWNAFFAHLSELYNSLPNVVVLFTSTLQLRNQLHSQMERQFKDRILMDKRFTLRLPEPAQVLDLYTKRIEFWLRGDPELLVRYRMLDNPYEPFTALRLEEIAGRESIRDTLQKFDKAFHEEMCTQVIEPSFDFLFKMNELIQAEEAIGEFPYVVDHLKTVKTFLERAAPWLPETYRISLEKTEMEDIADNGGSVLVIELRAAENPAVWIRAYLVLVSFMRIQDQITAATDLLKSRRAAMQRYTLWIVRAKKIHEWQPDYPDRTFHHVVLPGIESKVRALTHVLDKQTDYEKDDVWAEAQKFVRHEFGLTYLADLFMDARKRLDTLVAARQSGANDLTESATEAI